MQVLRELLLLLILPFPSLLHYILFHDTFKHAKTEKSYRNSVSEKLSSFLPVLSRIMWQKQQFS